MCLCSFVLFFYRCLPFFSLPCNFKFPVMSFSLPFVLFFFLFSLSALSPSFFIIVRLFSPYHFAFPVISPIPLPFVFVFFFLFSLFLSLSPFFILRSLQYPHFPSLSLSPFPDDVTRHVSPSIPSLTRGRKTFVLHWYLAAVIHAQSPMRAAPIRAHSQSIRAETGFRKTGDQRSNDGNGRSCHYLRVMR